MILTAAGLHAAWNILLKTAGDGEAAMMALTLTYALAGAAMIPFLGLPPPQLWPLLAASVALHVAYNLALVRAYREGDFSRAYPVSRGSAPLLAALAAAALLDEQMRPTQWAGMALAAGGVISLSFGRAFHLRQTAMALGIAAMIAAYSATDAAGVRLSEKIGGTALTYIAWAFALDGFAYVATVWLRRGRTLFSAGRRAWTRGVVGGDFRLCRLWAGPAGLCQSPCRAGGGRPRGLHHHWRVLRRAGLARGVCFAPNPFRRAHSRGIGSPAERIEARTRA